MLRLYTTTNAMAVHRLHCTALASIASVQYIEADYSSENCLSCKYVPILTNSCVYIMQDMPLLSPRMVDQVLEVEGVVVLIFYNGGVWQKCSGDHWPNLTNYASYYIYMYNSFTVLYNAGSPAPHCCQGPLQHEGNRYMNINNNLYYTISSLHFIYIWLLLT